MVNTSLTRRLTALEHATGAGRTIYRAYATHADADADSDTPDGVTVLRIITGVQRSPAVTPARP